MRVGPGAVVRFGVAFALACVLFPLSARPQQQDSQSDQSSSVADAARRAREQKKKSATAPKIITDEDLPSNTKQGPDGINVGSSPKLETDSPDPAQVAKIEAADKAADAQAAKDADEEDGRVAALKEQVAAAEKELDLLKRAFALDKDSYYSKTNFAADAAGKAKLDDEQQQIADKQQQVEDLKARLAPLLERQGKRKPAATEAPANQSETPANPNQAPANPPPQP